MQDSNLRPLGPKPSALPSCANHRHKHRLNGVADGARTHDNRNHNPGLYQLSYSHHGRTSFCCNGAPDRTRTYDPRLRRPLLYPAELRAPNSRPLGSLKWSVMQDSNLRPLGPKPSALPSCANHRLRYTTATGRNITAQPLERQTFFAAKKLIA
jgi:hypothetical protein